MAQTFLLLASVCCALAVFTAAYVEVRPLAPFHSIAVYGTIIVTVNMTDNDRLKAITPTELVNAQLLTTVSSDGVLSIRFANDVALTATVEVNAQILDSLITFGSSILTALNKITATTFNVTTTLSSQITLAEVASNTLNVASNGSSLVTVTILNAPVLNVNAVGSSIFTVSGTAPLVNLIQAGSSILHGSGLFCDQLFMAVEGSALVHANVNSLIKGTLQGSAGLLYTVLGNPSLVIQVTNTGSGAVAPN